MDKRIRSPNYPALSLPDAIARAGNLYRELHTRGAPRENIARAMGYNTLNGASATAISALHKYGLLEGGRDNLRVSERALRILHPHSPEEKAEAIREAAREPQLFNDLAERFPGGFRNEGLVQNYLIRSGFAQSAVPAVISAYRETSEMVEREEQLHDSAQEPAQEHGAMAIPIVTDSTTRVVPPLAVENAERSIGRYDFEDGSYVRIVAHGGVDTETILEMVKEMTETLIALKRKELARRKTAVPSAATSADVNEEKEDA
jgi:hypothetical protein